MGRIIGRLAAIAVFLIVQGALAGAAEIKVYSTIGVKGALEDLAPKFEKATGNKLNITWGLISVFTKKAQEGDVPDVLIVSRPSIDGLTKDGKIAAGGVTLGSSIFAFGVKHGAPKPDISTVDAHEENAAGRARRRLHQSGGGRRERRLFCQDDRETRHRLGDQGQEQISAARRLRRHAADRGEVDIAFQTKPELTTTEGVDVVGPPPGDLGQTNVFAAGVGAASKNSEAGKACSSS